MAWGRGLLKRPSSSSVANQAPTCRGSLRSPVALGKAQCVARNPIAVSLPGIDVAAIVNATVHPGNPGIVAHCVKAGGSAGKQIRENGRGRRRKGGVTRRVRRKIRKSDLRLDARIHL